MKPVFLTAEWRKLIMVNYRVDPSLLRPYLPAQTELDLFQGECLVSLVGFLFLHTRLLGISIPWHGSFEEFNLRFYVRRYDGKTWKRGTVFISEIVPKYTIPLVANTLYREHYVRYPMKSAIAVDQDRLNVSYSFRIRGHWNTLAATASPHAQLLSPGSLEEFITEHYWGYNRWDDHRTLEYAVEHPPWMCYPVNDIKVDIRMEDAYPQPFVKPLDGPPHSALLAEGSPIIVRKGLLLNV